MRKADAILAAVLVLALVPLFLVLALAVLLDSGRPLFYGESRLGRDGRRFRVHKFRTLRDGDLGSRLVAPVDDPRVTRVGRWLRRFRLDELPQLVNILRGEMAFVGPRPARGEFWDAVPAGLRDRALAFRPGLTSPASLRYLCEDAVLAEMRDPETVYREIIFPAKVAEDVRYFETRRFGGDLRVLLRTPVALMRQRHDRLCRDRLRKLVGRRAVRRSRGTDVETVGGPNRIDRREVK